MFYKRMNEYLLIYQHHINFQQIDLVSIFLVLNMFLNHTYNIISYSPQVFFPIISDDHYYMIVFNVKKESSTIIYNVDRKKSKYDPYGNIPYDLVSIFNLIVEVHLL